MDPAWPYTCRPYVHRCGVGAVIMGAAPAPAPAQALTLNGVKRNNQHFEQKWKLNLSL